MTYNGWTNHITWAVKLHFDNDEGIYSHFCEYLPTIGDEVHGFGSFTYTRERAHIIAEYLKDYAEEMAIPNWNDDRLSLFQSELVQSALNAVNWDELGAAYAEDYPYSGDDDEDDDDE